MTAYYPASGYSLFSNYWKKYFPPGPAVNVLTTSDPDVGTILAASNPGSEYLTCSPLLGDLRVQQFGIPAYQPIWAGAITLKVRLRSDVAQGCRIRQRMGPVVQQHNFATTTSYAVYSFVFSDLVTSPGYSLADYEFDIAITSASTTVYVDEAWVEYNPPACDLPLPLDHVGWFDTGYTLGPSEVASVYGEGSGSFNNGLDVITPDGSVDYPTPPWPGVGTPMCPNRKPFSLCIAVQNSDPGDNFMTAIQGGTAPVNASSGSGGKVWVCCNDLSNAFADNVGFYCIHVLQDPPPEGGGGDGGSTDPGGGNTYRLSRGMRYVPHDSIRKI